MSTADVGRRPDTTGKAQIEVKVMALPGKTISPSVYLIADHLDAVLAHGEDLLALASPPSSQAGQDLAQMQQYLADQRVFLEEVRAIEGRLVHRAMRAREHAEQLRRHDARFKMITDLFIGGTNSLADAAAELADSIGLEFNTGRDSIAYLRSRGMIGDGTVVLPRGFALKASETFRLAGSIELGGLLDLTAAYIDALELHYELYDEPLRAVTEAQPMKPASELPAANP